LKLKPCGFRFSRFDAVVLVLAAVATAAGWLWLGQIAALFIVVSLHFLLFCNVFRIPRLPELIWAVVFVINFCVWFALDQFSWAAILLVQTPLTLCLVVWSFCREDYHGVFWRFAPHPRRINQTHESPGTPP